MNTPVPKVEMPFVARDDLVGGKPATRHLIVMGRCNVVHIGSPLGSPYADRRRETGYREAMKQAGSPPRLRKPTE